MAVVVAAEDCMRSDARRMQRHGGDGVGGMLRSRRASTLRGRWFSSRQGRFSSRKSRLCRLRLDRLGCRLRTLLINLNRLDLPVHILKSRRVIAHIRLATILTTALVAHRTTRLPKDTTGPVAAKVGVDDDTLRLEFIAHIAGALEIAHRRAKVG